MDAFEEPFWNLDQLRAWALTRDPDLVRVAALPRVEGQQINSGLLAFRILHAATKLKADGRDVDAELWRASGMDPPKKLYSLPRALFRHAKDSEIAPNEVKNNSRSGGRSPHWSRLGPKSAVKCKGRLT